MDRLFIGFLLLTVIFAFPEESTLAPDLSSVHPLVTAAIVKPENHNTLTFYCDFTPPNGTDFFYNVKWGISTEQIWTYTLKRFYLIQYVDLSDFREKSALTEEILNDNNIYRLGFTLACSVTAFNTEGTTSRARQSSPKFFGIEVLNSTVVVNNKDDAAVYVRLTAPFGCPDSQPETCSIDLNVYIPTESDSCKIPGLVQRKGNMNRCGLTIRNDQINAWIPLYLAALDGEIRLDIRRTFNLILSTPHMVPYHQFFANYYIHPIKVVVHTNMTLLKNSLCYSHSDPRIKTLDGTWYTYDGRKYMLYKNSKHKTQVQVKTNALGNCGVAVNAGRDVLIATNCEGEKWDIRFSLCEDGILGGKVKMMRSSKYQVTLPTGTKVIVTKYMEQLNVDIAPSLADYQNTEGLCGRFDKDLSNDNTTSFGSTETDPVASWRVTADEDLFDPSNYESLTPWQEDHQLCSCNVDMFSAPLDFVCQSEESKTCEDSQGKPILEYQCPSVARKKRNVDGLFVAHEKDLHQTMKTISFSKRSATDIQHSKKLVSKRTTYDHESATNNCLLIFNTTAAEICSSTVGIDTSGYVENCIEDVQMKNSLDWSLLHLELLKDMCINEVKVNQPLSEEDMADIEVIVNDTVINLDTTAGDMSQIPSYTAELLQQLQEVSCPFECNGNGICNNGTCACYSEYIGSDCSKERRLPPFMEGIANGGMSGIATVFASYLADTPELSCRLVPFVINFENETVTGSNALIVSADLQTWAEVSCSLPHPTNFDELGNYIASGYAISLSNDGIVFSEEDTLLIYDSTCINCMKENGTVYCGKQEVGEYCVKSGICYTLGDPDC